MVGGGDTQKEGKRGETWAATYMTDLFSFSDLKKIFKSFFFFPKNAVLVN